MFVSFLHFIHSLFVFDEEDPTREIMAVMEEYGEPCWPADEACLNQPEELDRLRAALVQRRGNSQ